MQPIATRWTWMNTDKLSVLVSSGCHSNITKTRWLINNRNFFLTALVAGSSRSRPGSGKLSFPDCRRLTSCSSHGGMRTREIFEIPFMRVLVHFLTAPPSGSYYLPKSPLPNIIALRFICQHMNLGEMQTFSPEHCFIWLWVERKLRTVKEIKLVKDENELAKLSK